MLFRIALKSAVLLSVSWVASSANTRTFKRNFDKLEFGANATAKSLAIPKSGNRPKIKFEIQADEDGNNCKFNAHVIQDLTTTPLFSIQDVTLGWQHNKKFTLQNDAGAWC